MIRNLLISFIGISIVLGGMHIMPVHAMSHDESMQISCGTCPSDDLMNTDCDEVEQEHNNLFTESSTDDCGCHYESHEGQHHTAVFQTLSQFNKVKNFTLNRFFSLHEPDVHNHEFHSAFNINAPPAGYMQAMGSVRQLK